MIGHTPGTCKWRDAQLGATRSPEDLVRRLRTLVGIIEKYGATAPSACMQAMAEAANVIERLAS